MTNASPYPVELQVFEDWLRAQRGVVRVEAVPKELLDAIEKEESTVTSIFGTPVDNSGLADCLTMNTVLIAFTDRDFWTPSCVSMILWNSEGDVIGQDIPWKEAESYQNRNDVVFISDSFVLFTDKNMGTEPYMELKSMEYSGEDESFPDNTRSVMWFPCATSSMMVFDYFHQPRDCLGTAIIAFNM